MSKLGFIAAIVLFASSISGFVAAQEVPPTITSTATLTETPTETPEPTTTLTLFRDADSLTLFIPFADARVSLAGLEYRVALSDGQTIERQLDRDFTSFLGLPFDEINLLGAACFRLARVGANVPVPIQCSNGPLLLAQQLADADVFWFDGAAGLERIVTIWQGDTFVGLCQAGQSACPIEIALLPDLPTATPTHHDRDSRIRDTYSNIYHIRGR